MELNDRISTRIDRKLKKDAVKVFRQIGITEGEAIRMFYAQVKMHQGLPFRVAIPNEETLAAMKEGDKPENLPSYESFSDLRSELGI